MTFVGYCRGENIYIATLFQLQSFTEFCHCHGKVPYGKVSLINVSQRFFQFTFVHGGSALDDELTAGEAVFFSVRDKQMTIPVELSHLKPLLH